jgi:Fe-S cluster biosynthesis and repair protein YggX
VRLVHCIKLGRDLPGLPAKPFPNELGQRLYDSVSQEAWGMWLQQSKLLINEGRLNLSSPESRQFLMEQCERYFFGPGMTLPPDYVPPTT